jgi:hypothetical protein
MTITEAKTCVSCGMPLRTLEDVPTANPTAAWCRHCAQEDGTLKAYDEVLAGMISFLTRTQGLDARVAQETAARMLAHQPAWSGRDANLTG